MKFAQFSFGGKAGQKFAAEVAEKNRAALAREELNYYPKLETRN